MPNTLVSDDGRWWWDGKQWLPMQQAKPPLFASQSGWAIVLALVIIPPLGLFLLWTHRECPLWLKAVVTAIVVPLVMGFVWSRFSA